jgi:hypothetical protein
MSNFMKLVIALAASGALAASKEHTKLITWFATTRRPVSTRPARRHTSALVGIISRAAP